MCLVIVSRETSNLKQFRQQMLSLSGTRGELITTSDDLDHVCFVLVSTRSLLDCSLKVLYFAMKKFPLIFTILCDLFRLTIENAKRDFWMNLEKYPTQKTTTVQWQVSLAFYLDNKHRSKMDRSLEHRWTVSVSVLELVSMMNEQ